ncbi:Uncharacterised protein [Yersinia aldovae]|nr:Uncharacterised protein [Yersinia aldovae]
MLLVITAQCVGVYPANSNNVNFMFLFVAGGVFYGFKLNALQNIFI